MDAATWMAARSAGMVASPRLAAGPSLASCPSRIPVVAPDATRTPPAPCCDRASRTLERRWVCSTACTAIVIRTLEAHALGEAVHQRRSGWYHAPSIAIEVSLSLIWLCTIVLLVPASSIGASELFAAGRGSRARAATFVAWLCVAVDRPILGERASAEDSRGFLFAPDAWLHDGRSWWALMCSSRSSCLLAR